jgi:putative PIN family toxin of toxin-antitoxin system
MRKVVLDTTVLVSAFLKPVKEGVAHQILRFAKESAFELFISDYILQELAEVLLRPGRNRRRYQYPDSEVVEFCKGLARFATLVTNVADIKIVRDPSDDPVVACAVAAGAEFLVSRDNDLLSVVKYAGIKIVTPEAFLRTLRHER